MAHLEGKITCKKTHVLQSANGMAYLEGKITSMKTPVLQMVWHIWKAKVAMINQPQVLHMELINKNIL